MEAKIVGETDIVFHGIHAGKMRRYFSFRNFIDWFKVPIGFVQSLIILIRYRPKVIFSKGGYVAVPVCFAAWVLRIPVIIHDSDVVPGLASKITGKIARKICVSWEKSLQYFPKGIAVVTGVPVRSEISEGTKAAAMSFLGGSISNNLPVLLVVGGSLGAQFLNEFVFSNISELSKNYNIVHITGDMKESKANLKTTVGWYKVISYGGSQYPNILALADVVLTRSGATALAEFAVLQKPLILVPLPKSSSRGDQIDNAIEYTNTHPESRFVLQEDVSLKKILELLPEVLNVEIQKSTTKSNAVLKIVAEIEHFL